jgi:hypothetical protein
MMGAVKVDSTTDGRFGKPKDLGGYKESIE